MLGVGQDIKNDNPYEDDFSFSKYQISGRSVLKVLILAIIVCFFCPMFMVSCSGAAVGSFRFSCSDLLMGIGYMGEEMEKMPVFEPFLILPVVTLIHLFLPRHRKWHGMICIASCGTCGLALPITYMVLKRQNYGAPLQIDVLTAFYLYILFSLTVAVIGIYIDFLYRRKEAFRLGIPVSVLELKRKSIIMACGDLTVSLILFGVLLYVNIYL